MLLILLTSLGFWANDWAGKPHVEATIASPDAGEVALVKSRFQYLQHQSFRTDREYCGYLIRDRFGVLGVTPMRQGSRNGCSPVPPGPGVEIVASMHTHGAFSAGIAAEFPTVLDMVSDLSEGINGYVATPGGRLWFIDTGNLIVRQMCSPGCLPQDPDYQPHDEAVIAESYSLKQLRYLQFGR